MRLFFIRSRKMPSKYSFINIGRAGHENYLLIFESDKILCFYCFDETSLLLRRDATSHENGDLTSERSVLMLKAPLYHT